MTDWIMIFAKAFWCGCAATGFGILFNTPSKILVFVGIGGFLAGLVKFIFLDSGVSSGIILSTFAAAACVGVASIPVARRNDLPTVIFTIPSVIPLVPGVFAYRTMLGLMKLSGLIGDEYSKTLSETVRNGVITLFVVMAIALGTVIPTLILEKRFIHPVGKHRK